VDLQALAQIGEFVGGIAVVITLIYLARQIHQGTSAQQRETSRSYVTELNRVLMSPMSDPEMMSLLQQAAKDFDNLSLRDQGVVNSVWSPVFILIDRIHAERERNGIDDALAVQLDIIVLGFVQMPGTAQWFERIRPFWSQEFLGHIDKLLSNPDRTPAMNEILPWYFPDPEQEITSSAHIAPDKALNRDG